ncbi:probable mediator of RNA polymerase II transcription subunit 26c isoform X2 [Neltuma alba]|uniref:probable mediator of RNA polymerase II transcription subunit 26c isoform X2 n=1 Tax=Neltuma alba TaxID=207710 RepID=UPI0010A492B1|nr:probable mediator of RNA polymerase II transcription subunit 26c isoform X2 [Prosopis alba]
MDLDDFRSVLETAGVDVWMFIDTAIDVASIDYHNELKRRRDGIVQRLYEATSAPGRCRNCEAIRLKSNGHEIRAPIEKQSSPELKRDASPVTPHSIGQDDGDLDPYGGLFDDEEKKIQEIKEQLEDQDQPEDYVVELLQNLADMDITFQALKETDIGRHVNRLRKHPSNDVRRLVKLLVRKWKEIVDEWVKLMEIHLCRETPRTGTIRFLILHPRLIRTIGVLGQTETTQKLNQNQRQFLEERRQNQQTQCPCLLLLLKIEREKREIAILKRTDLLRQEGGFKRTTKRLKMPKDKERSK